MVVVSVDKEVPEQKPEENCVEADPPHEAARVVALAEQQLERVHKDRHELHHLNRCHVFLHVFWRMVRNERQVRRINRSCGRHLKRKTGRKWNGKNSELTFQKRYLFICGPIADRP